MDFIETRGNDEKREKAVSFQEAILDPSASFGGLYVPKTIPKISSKTLKSWENLTYKELAKKILESFSIDLDPSFLEEALNCYDLFDDPLNPVPTKEIDTNLFCCELWHGPTRAFKDMALQPFGSILSKLAQKREENYLVLAATSGDTGPAALSSFGGKDRVKVVCLYPDGGTSDVQRLQMVTMDDENLKVIGIRGNFDDAQNALKTLLLDEDFKDFLGKNNLKLSAANSVNFGRIIFQIIYHFHTYLTLLKNQKIKEGEKIDIVVPSGNFGNVLGAFYAKSMGVPIDTLGVTSNDNNILTELIQTGVYDIREKNLIQTTSPAMDILKSSNVERILFHKFGAKRTKELLENLEQKSYYSLTQKELLSLQEDFDGCFATEEDVAQYIKKYSEKNYILDPHTATCIKWAEKREKTTVIYSTAEWTKFSVNVLNGIETNHTTTKDEEALSLIEKKFALKTPQSISSLFSKPIQHQEIIEKETIKESIKSFLTL